MNDADALDLLEAIKLRDEGAFKRLYDGCSPEVFRAARGIVWKDEAAVEVVQDAMMKVWEKPEAFRGQSTVIKWIKGIARNMAKSKVRDQFGAPDQVDEDYEKLVEDPENDQFQRDPPFKDALETLISQQSAEQLHRCMGKLSSRRREIVYLRFYEDKKETEVASIMGLPLGGVKSGFFEGRHQLAKCLEGSGLGKSHGGRNEA